MVVERRAVGHGIVVHLLDIDVVGILKDAHFLPCDVAEDAHREAGAWERVALDKTLGHLQLITHAANLILEEPFQRFAELELHVLWQATNVVVALYGHARDT